MNEKTYITISTETLYQATADEGNVLDEAASGVASTSPATDCVGIEPPALFVRRISNCCPADASRGGWHCRPRDYVVAMTAPTLGCIRNKALPRRLTSSTGGLYR